MPNDGVNPTARWLARGIWKFMFVLVATLLVLGLVGLVVRAALGVPGEGPGASISPKCAVRGAARGAPAQPKRRLSGPSLDRSRTPPARE
jgi:hypothetical protein